MSDSKNRCLFCIDDDLKHFALACEKIVTNGNLIYKP